MRCVVLLLPLVLSSARADGPPGVDYERDIQPIFKARCYSCHDARKQTAGLRLDVRSRAFKGGESGKQALVKGKPAASELLARLTSSDEALRMPPSKPLAPEQIDLIRRWIEGGASWPDALAGEPATKHWAFLAPVRAPVPAVTHPAWAHNAIDRFVLARLEREKLAPAAPADRVTLCRRVFLDLTGLPPTPAEVDAFVQDTSPDAHERLVDRLLASPAYGERWARIWLDAARYADSDGYEKDKPRFVWMYREWVIHALNRDLGYDRFLLEQLAGDLLPGASQEQRVATGYLRNSMINEEGGIDPEQFRMEAMFDRMDAIGKGVLGLTIQCAQCHTHKYDPLTHREYYRLFAFLNNAHEANITVYTPMEQSRRADLFAQINRIEEDLRHRNPAWRERLARWEKEVTKPGPRWNVLRPTVLDESTGGQKYLLQPDGSFLAQGYAPTKHRVHLTTRVEGKLVTAFQIELLQDANLPRGGPGRSIEGTGALSEFDLEVADAAGKHQRVKFAKATSDVAMPITPLKEIYSDKSGRKRLLGPVSFAIDGKDDTAWGIDIDPGRRNQPRKAVFTLAEPIRAEKGVTLHLYLKQNHGGWNSDDNQNNNLGRFRLSWTDAPDAEADPLPARVRTILALPADKRTEKQTHELFSYWRTTVPEWQAENARIEQLWKTHPEGTTQLVLRERQARRTTRVLKRGDFLKPAEEVAPAVPAFLNPLPADVPLNRIGLARWLTDRKAPTTARALVNRVWQTYFGTGIVATSEDLGLQADPPSHPELLDWLAVEFMESGWSLKHLHRLIVTSATYRQASHVTPEQLARDPDNRLLARGPRLRVEAEVVRDIALAASGLLTTRLGGPSAYPPLPGFLVQPPASYGPKVWQEDTGPNRYRRALYTFGFRSIPYPALQAFDAPNGDFACVKRARSNTPLQALTALNEPLFLECARALAARVQREGGASDEQRIDHAYRLCVARLPEPAERKVLQELLGRQRKRSGENEAWVSVARVLLNLDETITKE